MIALGALSTQTHALTPFQASYQFLYNGKNMGSATRTLKHTAGDNWSYNFSAKAGVLASANENSTFALSNGKIISNQFSRSSKVLVHNNTLNIKFNPSSKVISTKKDSTARSFAWKPGALDELNAELQLREDLQKSGLKSNYLIADAKGLDTRKFVKLGTENVKTPYGTFSAIKVRLEHSKPERNTIFWLAPKLDYAPVKVTHNDGGSSYGLLITSYKDSAN
ncbi:MAG: DUF3108 domain-containing protein [Acinetobacter sp.]